MAQKKLLCSLIILPCLCLGNNDLDDLIASQDLIVKQNMLEANKFICEANNHASKHKLQAAEIIKNSNSNRRVYGNFDWFNELNLRSDESAVASLQEYELYIFVSLSMPQARLIELLRDAKQYDGMVVLRGLKNNSYKDTANYLQKIIEKAGAGLMIEPNLFTEYNITKVPTFVLNDSVLKKYDKVTGNVTLKYALAEMKRHGELKNILRDLQ